MTRKEFLKDMSLVTSGAALAGGRCWGAVPSGGCVRTADDAALDVGQRETDLVKPEAYLKYLDDGNTRGLAALEKLERGYAKMLDEIASTTVGATPAVWLVYNMGVIVKTRESLFSIDFVHRRSVELAPKLDFALITHNHEDHYLPAFYRTMNRSGKTVINNFIDNYGAVDWRKGGTSWCEHGGYTRTEKTFRIRDVEIRTALTDHNSYLIDYTMTFEIRVGDWRMFHTGDCGNAQKLKTVWGRPDLWVLFPGCGIRVDEAYRRIRPEKIAFGHLWELAHHSGRLTTSMVRAASQSVTSAGGQVVVPFYGERIV